MAFSCVRKRRPPLPDVCLSEKEWFLLLDFDNASTIWRGKSGKGDRFGMTDAKVLERMEELRLFERNVLFVGKGVARKFLTAAGIREMIPPFERRNGWRWIPHTSGIVRFWNDVENRKKCENMFAEIVKEARDS